MTLNIEALSAERARLLARIEDTHNLLDAAYERLQRPPFPHVERGYPSVYARPLIEQQVYVEVAPGKWAKTLDAVGWDKLAELVEREHAFGDATAVYAEAYRSRAARVEAWEAAVSAAEEQEGIPTLLHGLAALQKDLDAVELAILSAPAMSMAAVRLKAGLLLEGWSDGINPDPRPLLRDLLEEGIFSTP